MPRKKKTVQVHPISYSMNDGFDSREGHHSIIIWHILASHGFSFFCLKRQASRCSTWLRFSNHGTHATNHCVRASSGGRVKGPTAVVNSALVEKNK